MKHMSRVSNYNVKKKGCRFSVSVNSINTGMSVAVFRVTLVGTE